MRKITIELPDDVTEEEAIRAIRRSFDPDWMASWWHISDIQDCATAWGDDLDDEAITDEEAREVLRLLEKYHDCEVGICWSVIEGWIDEVKQQRKEVA